MWLIFGIIGVLFICFKIIQWNHRASREQRTAFYQFVAGVLDDGSGTGLLTVQEEAMTLLYQERSWSVMLFPDTSNGPYFRVKVQTQHVSLPAWLKIQMTGTGVLRFLVNGQPLPLNSRTSVYPDCPELYGLRSYCTNKEVALFELTSTCFFAEYWFERMDMTAKRAVVSLIQDASEALVATKFSHDVGAFWYAACTLNPSSSEISQMALHTLVTQHFNREGVEALWLNTLSLMPQSDAVMMVCGMHADAQNAFLRQRRTTTQWLEDALIAKDLNENVFQRCLHHAYEHMTWDELDALPHHFRSLYGLLLVLFVNVPTDAQITSSGQRRTTTQWLEDALIVKDLNENVFRHCLHKAHEHMTWDALEALSHRYSSLYGTLFELFLSKDILEKLLTVSLNWWPFMRADVLLAHIKSVVNISPYLGPTEMFVAALQVFERFSTDQRETLAKLFARWLYIQTNVPETSERLLAQLLPYFTRYDAQTVFDLFSKHANPQQYGPVYKVATTAPNPSPALGLFKPWFESLADNPALLGALSVSAESGLSGALTGSQSSDGQLSMTDDEVSP